MTNIYSYKEEDRMFRTTIKVSEKLLQQIEDIVQERISNKYKLENVWDRIKYLEERITELEKIKTFK